MRKRIEWEWEKLDEKTARAKVLGGWIVLHIQQTFLQGEMGKKADIKIVNSESMVFIVDRDHEWSILPPVREEVQVKKDKSDEFAPK